MLILLPPSEGKTPVTTGDPLDLDRLSAPELTATRRRVLAALIKLSNGQPGRARRVLGLSERQLGELERNQQLEQAPAGPAIEVYTGVLYDSLSYDTLASSARRRLDRWVRVSSALWGALRLRDQIPAYRLSIDVALPRLGPVSTLWRPALAQSLPEAAGNGLVFDLRSGGYAKMWRPEGELAERTVVGRILQRRPDGSVKVVSHHNKATKGRLLRSLAEQPFAPRTCQALADRIESLGYEAQLAATQPGSARHLDIVVDDL